MRRIGKVQNYSGAKYSPNMGEASQTINEIERVIAESLYNSGLKKQVETKLKELTTIKENSDNNQWVKESTIDAILVEANDVPLDKKQQLRDAYLSGEINWAFVRDLFDGDVPDSISGVAVINGFAQRYEAQLHRQIQLTQNAGDLVELQSLAIYITSRMSGIANRYEGKKDRDRSVFKETRSWNYGIKNDFHKAMAIEDIEFPYL
ncbi:MAG: hypothetical protein Q9M91_04120 [Candidatus Dojkabacteria bacterium]|nr:hypothetical protein [Candidatus Dojkabacteria bacterium]MDQ7021000.1 hypothetical protein [Candidatus Dojkabacteria bacterium]